MSEMVYNREMKHYGIKRESGRYPWGSGMDPYGRSVAFYQIVDKLKADGIPEKEIAKAIGIQVKELSGDPKAAFSIADLRATKTIAREIIVQEQTHQAVKMREKNMSIDAIAKALNMEPPTVRLRLKNSENLKKSKLTNTVDAIRDEVNKHKIVDVGKGVDIQMGIADTKLNAALSVLRDEGYETYNLKVRNVATKNMTTRRVIVPPGTGFATASRMRNEIHTMGKWTENDAETMLGVRPPVAVSAKRVKVQYESPEDGVVYVRDGKADLSMGKNTYAQVRIAVGPNGGTHYIKGMALKSKDLPEGVDLVVHTNKKPGTPLLGDKDNSVLKPMKTNPDGTIDMDNPFGSMINRQILSPDGKKAVSALNLVNEEGDWEGWRDSLPSQMLSKQPQSLIKSQLQVTRDQVNARLKEIESITHPVVRKAALEDFADKLDSDAVDLRAASMPRQKTRVIIPIQKINKGEIYAPDFETGERVALIRYPHGGRFEIPEVTVNNNNRTAKKLLGNAKDAIGLHPTVAERLSGADFDGDTVIVIPNRSGKIKSDNSPAFASLRSFEPKTLYGGFVKSGVDKDGNDIGNFPLMRNTGKEMGVITNLITDMSIQGAKPDHIVRAVKHSMVVIDAEKHRLNYKQSEKDHNIAQLKELYQSKPLPDGTVKVGGASTLLSKATASVRVPDFKERPMSQGGPVDPKTGERVYVPTGKTRSVFDKKTGTYTDEKVAVTRNAKRLALTNDAFTLVRDPSDPVERLYAEHANAMKSIANSARLKSVRTADPKINTKARVVYKDEVSKLKADLNAAKAQKPLERRANQIAEGFFRAKLQDDPTLRYDADRRAKVERQAKNTALARLGLQKPVIDISDRQWDAIMSGAVSSSMLRQILDYADPKRVNDLALPRTNPVMTSAIAARASAMLSGGAAPSAVAAALGISTSTLRAAVERGDVSG